MKTKPILSGKKEKVAVVAIDFGSTHSGFAYSLLRPPQTVVLSADKKQPTAALFERDTLKLVSFGQDAREFFMRTLAGDLLLDKFSQTGETTFSKSKYLYFDGDIKMRLWENQHHANEHEDITREEELDARTCRTLGGNEKAKLLEIVSKILERIKGDALEAVNLAVIQEQQRAAAAVQSAAAPPPTIPVNPSTTPKGTHKKSVFSRDAPNENVLPTGPPTFFPTMTDVTRATTRNASSSVTSASSPTHTRKKDSSLMAIKHDDVLWVLTVPAIWRESDKQFMRKACHNAGIIDEPYSSELVLALEPECAALAARFDLPNLDVSPGQKLLVLDCGGGTCDVCAVEVVPAKRFQCKLLLVPSGGDWGGVKIDENFSKFIEKLFGSAILERCAVVSPACLIELQDQWEKLKTGLTIEDYLDETGERKQDIDVTYILRESKSSLSLKDLAKQFNSSTKDKTMHVWAKSESLLGEKTLLRIPVKLLRTFFDPIFDPIVAHARYLFNTFPSELSSLNQILLVGGVGSSPYLKYKFEKAFPTKKILNSSEKNSSALVAYGAVKFGLQPSVISTRKARMTLGVKATVEYNSQLHRGRMYRENKFFDRQTKKHYIRNVFKPFLIAGEDVESEREVVHKFQPPSVEADRVKFDVYTCDERPPVEFIMEEGCRLLARIYVPVVKGEMPILEVRLKIGFTEIAAEVRKASTGEVVMNRVLFEFHPDANDEAARREEQEENSRFERVLEEE